MYRGVDALALAILRDPGPKAGGAEGSGFLCIENDDQSAARLHGFFAEAGIEAANVIPWNEMTIVDADVRGRPVTFGNAAKEAPWKAAVAEAIGTHDVPVGARFQVEVEFRLPVPVTRNDAWDLDNLLKPTLDALGGVVGWRRWNGPRQADDERIDRIVASKRTVRDGESVGARIRVSILRDDPAASMIDARS